MRTVTYRTRLAVTAGEAYAWHTRPGAFERLAPPWENVAIIDRHGTIRKGDWLALETRLGPLRLRWKAVHEQHVEGASITDVQESGPFKFWRHSHRFEEKGRSSSQLVDRIVYELPFEPVSRLLAGKQTRSKIDRMFRYRHETTAGDLRLHRRLKGEGVMKVAITGSTGLVGTALTALLTSGGHEVLSISRGSSGENLIWDPYSDKMESAGLEGVDAVVHLSGENIAGRWSSEKKKRIRESRIKGTTLLSNTLAGMKAPPKVLVAASAIGYYGERGETILDEEAESGQGFLAEVCREWEAATQPAVEKGIRVVNLRIGVVLTPQGGALQKMLLPFKMGAGGVVGSGRQYWSWITLDDVIGAIYHALATDELSGPVNAVAPNPVTNREFTKILGEVLSRPTLFPLPGFAARLALGEMADELLLSSTRVKPKKLLASGYEFRKSDLESALRHVLGR